METTVRGFGLAGTNQGVGALRGIDQAPTHIQLVGVLPVIHKVIGIGFTVFTEVKGVAIQWVRYSTILTNNTLIREKKLVSGFNIKEVCKFCLYSKKSSWSKRSLLVHSEWPAEFCLVYGKKSSRLKRYLLIHSEWPAESYFVFWGISDKSYFNSVERVYEFILRSWGQIHARAMLRNICVFTKLFQSDSVWYKI